MSTLTALWMAMTGAGIAAEREQVMKKMRAAKARHDEATAAAHRTLTEIDCDDEFDDTLRAIARDMRGDAGDAVDKRRS